MKRSLLTLFLLIASNMSAIAQETTKPLMDESTKLHAIIEEEWEYGLREYPTSATWAGDARYDDRWSDLSPQAIERRKAHARELVARIEKIDRSKLSADDQLNYDLFLRDAKMEVEGLRFPSELLQISQMGGVHQDVADIAQVMPRRTSKDFSNIISRYRATPRLVDETIALLRKGLSEKVTLPQISLREVATAIRNQIVTDPMKSPLYAIAFSEMPATMTAAEQKRLRDEALAAIRNDVMPAYARLLQFFEKEYYPKARSAVGLSTVAGGKEWYAYNVRRMTTTDLTPDQIHAIGVGEVKRIRAEMESVMRSTGFAGTLEEFFTFLRTDPRFFHTSPEALLADYRDIAKRIDPELIRLFGTLPRLPYGVIPVPAYSEKTQTTAYYYPGSPEGGRPGYFYANTYDLASRPKWEMEALTIHEAVPGHHLQIALAQELPNVPKFRRFGGYTAFVEGWGLYSESLGPELGLYKDPYSRFGQLTYEMWRAVRLVVDTGMHHKGWTRQQAIDFFSANSSKPLHDITVEIDRYIVWPGQALAYKLGELKIKELRAHATTTLGERFDIRKFHDVLLGAGPLPLSILESRVKEWLATERGRP